MGDKGFLHAMVLGLSCRTGACGWLAPVCSSWVFMNRGTSRRNRARPLGPSLAQEYVHMANRRAACNIVGISPFGFEDRSERLVPCGSSSIEANCFCFIQCCMCARMISRCVLLALAMVAAGCYVCIEQPSSSVAILHPRMQFLVKTVKVCLSMHALFQERCRGCQTTVAEIGLATAPVECQPAVTRLDNVFERGYAQGL